MAPPPMFVVVSSYLPRNYYFSIKGGGGGREEAVFAPPTTPNIVLFHRFPAILPREKWMIEIIMRGKEAEREKESVFSFSGKIEAVFLTFFCPNKRGPRRRRPCYFEKKKKISTSFSLISDLRKRRPVRSSLFYPLLRKQNFSFLSGPKSLLCTHTLEELA